MKHSDLWPITPGARDISLKEVQPGDLIVIPHHSGSVSYLIVEKDYFRSTGEFRINYICSGIAADSGEFMFDTAVSVEETGSSFCTYGVLLKNPTKRKV